MLTTCAQGGEPHWPQLCSSAIKTKHLVDQGDSPPMQITNYTPYIQRKACSLKYHA